jgi:hypothetical protein
MTDVFRAWQASRHGRQRQASRTELIRLYEIAVEEYRFQVQLNWNRAQYLLGFNTAVIAAGAALIKLNSSKKADPLIAGIFVVGLVAALMSMSATYMQHGYYRAARDHMRLLANQLELGEAAVTTTPGMRGALPRRLGKMQTILYMLFAVVAVINFIGILYVLGITL